MSDTKTICEFRFVTNSSFVKSRVITIPSRCYEGLKENGVGEGIVAAITFRDGVRMNGSIRTGWRAGGRYYQIRIATADANREIGQLKMGTALGVRIETTAEGWHIELR